jgi:hypothetical protein
VDCARRVGHCEFSPWDQQVPRWQRVSVTIFLMTWLSYLWWSGNVATVALAPLYWWKRITASGQDAVVGSGTGNRATNTDLLAAGGRSSLLPSGPHSAVFGGEIGNNTSAVAVGGLKTSPVAITHAVVGGSRFNDAPIVKRWLLAAGNIPVANTLRVRR